ncbi:MAG: baseplate J/gp47 family protein [Methylococcaceae bacterium]|nr:baseplate J/gp47 family protein [Methylococcaceae bacterium]
MSELTPLPLFDRDGTSQTHRKDPALNPEFIAVDERTLKDWLAFAHAFSKELNYFDSNNQVNGDWSGFLNPEQLTDIDLKARWEEVEKFLAAPEKFKDSKFDNHRRPHFVLFLAFLQLLKLTQGRLNTLTRSHLDFYFQKVLRLEKKQGIPDRVHIIVKASPYTEQMRLPAGTLLNAGKDKLGKELAYSTDSEIIVNHAQIERLSSVFVHKQITGIREAREQYKDDNKAAIIAMLKISLGEPLPLYANKEVNFDLLQQLQTLVKFASANAGLFLDLWELRSLLLLKNRQQGADDDWTTINDILKQAGKKRDNSFNLQITGRNFDANLKTALAPDFSKFSDIHNIYELYEQCDRDDAQKFIDKQLYMTLEQFKQMMKIKVAIDKDWRDVNALLEKAGKRRSLTYNFTKNTASPEFDDNLKDALPNLSFPSVTDQTILNLTAYDKAIKDLEMYFFMKAEDFLFIMNTAGTKKDSVSPPDWESVYDKLAVAHKEKIYAWRRAELAKFKTKQSLTLEEQKEAVQNMIQSALENATVDITDSNLNDQIAVFLPKDQNLSIIDSATNKDNKNLILTDKDWQTLYELLELVWRNRLGIEPVAQKEEWLYLSANEDAKSILASGSVDSPRWRTFGQEQSTLDKDHPPAAKLGWIISSPILALSQGIRTVTLTLGFQSDQFDQAKIALLESSSFLIQISTAKGWIDIDASIVTNTPNIAPEKHLSENEKYDYAALTSITVSKPLKALGWKLDFDETIPPITPLPDKEAFIDSPYPLLRLLLLPHWETDAEGKNGKYVTPYPLFQSLLLERVLLHVKVQGLTDFYVQNDDTVLNSVKPFEPFGNHPSVGSRLYFGHSELVSKRLNSIGLNLQWMGVPNNLATHYANYTYPVTTTKKDVTTTTQESLIGDNTTFKTAISLVDQNLEISLKPQAELFKVTDASQKHTIEVSITKPTLDNRPNYVYQRDLTTPTDNDLKSWRRYFYLELNAPDFQHNAYPSVASAKSIELATAIVNKKPDDSINAALYQVNPPYTPKLKSFSIDYESSEEIVIAQYQTGTGAERIFHQHPFGYAEIQPTQESESRNFLPLYDHEGELYIGLNGVQSPQKLSMLMQMAEGSANPDLDLATVEWSYLSNNRWISLRNGSLNEGHILNDATHGLIDSGILHLQLVSVLPNTLLPPQLYWLRAAIPKDCNSVCDTVDIHTQAVAATFVNRDNSPDHLSQPLPVNTISKTLEPLSDISALLQPYTSFGGKPIEQNAMFNVRVSERLRHKQRALTAWDYERLILEKFPQIYKAKCLSQALPKHPSDLGRVEIIVIPDIRNRFPFNPFEPKAPAGLIAEIKRFLTDYMPPFANVTVKNAHYVPVKVRFAVRFMPNCDPEFYKRQLNEDLNEFLAPWAFNANSDIVIGGSIYANAIINFIERLDYVDYLARFKLFSSEDGSIFKPVLETPDSDGYLVQAGRPDGVLVAAHEHEIDLITEARFVNENFTGINYMRIELDFIVGSS